MKTNEQMAYEAYCAAMDWKSLVNGKALPQWEDLKPEIKAAWKNAGEKLKAEIANQTGQIGKLADFIKNKIPNGLGQDESPVDCAIRILASRRLIEIPELFAPGQVVARRTGIGVEFRMAETGAAAEMTMNQLMAALSALGIEEA